MRRLARDVAARPERHVTAGRGRAGCGDAAVSASRHPLRNRLPCCRHARQPAGPPQIAGHLARGNLVGHHLRQVSGVSLARVPVRDMARRSGDRRGAAAATPPPKLAEVARRAGVSVGTASKALNGRGQLRAETRTRVQEAAAALGFRPNPYARGLVQGRTYTVGLITDDGFGRFSIPVMLGAEDALGAGQMAVFFCDTREDPIRERHFVSMLVGRRVDGVIVTGRVTDVRRPLDVPPDIPRVYAMIRSADPADACVTYDDEAGGRLAVEHLVAVGRRCIAYVTGPRHHHSASARFAGWVAALADAGLSQVRPDLAFGAWSEEWG